MRHGRAGGAETEAVALRVSGALPDEYRDGTSAGSLVLFMRVRGAGSRYESTLVTLNLLPMAGGR